MRRIVLLLTIACLLLSCNKDDALDAGIETKVFGMIYDTPNDIPFENLKLQNIKPIQMVFLFRTILFSI